MVEVAEEARHREVADLDQDQQLQPVQVKLKLWIIRDTLGGFICVPDAYFS